VVRARGRPHAPPAPEATRRSRPCWRRRSTPRRFCGIALDPGGAAAKGNMRRRARRLHGGGHPQVRLGQQQGRPAVDLAAHGARRRPGRGGRGEGAQWRAAASRPARPPALWRPCAPRRGDGAGQASRRHKVLLWARRGAVPARRPGRASRLGASRGSLLEAAPLSPWRNQAPFQRGPPSCLARPCRAAGVGGNAERGLLF